MIAYQTYCQIIELHQTQHLTACQIAQQLKVHRKTVAKWIKRKSYEPRARAQRSSKLDPFKGQIVLWLEQHGLSAQQIFQRLTSEGYQGGYSVVQAFVRLVRPKPKPAFLTLDFPPGQCAQVDWGTAGYIQIGATKRRLHFFTAVLCHSRLLYVEFSLSQSQEHFLNCHYNAFRYFGGVPQKIMVDNCKTAIQSHEPGLPARPNARYLDFSRHYGFDIKACGVKKPHEKGRVENGVGYVKNNFLRGLELPAWEALPLALQQWLDTVANVRQHAQTRTTPRLLHAQEKPLLKPLNSQDYDISRILQVRANTRFRVHFEGNCYSVPAHLASSSLLLKISPSSLRFYHENQVVTEHVRCYDRHQDLKHPDHEQALLAQRQKARDQNLQGRFLALCPEAAEYYRQLQQRRFNLNHHIRKIMALNEIYGPDLVVRALRDAFEYQAFSCEYIANILEARQRQLPEPGALHLTRASDLLDLDLPEPDLSIYDPKPNLPEL